MLYDNRPKTKPDLTGAIIVELIWQDIERAHEDEASGKAQTAVICPIAQALNRITGQIWLVGPFSAALAVAATQYHPLPDIARDFIRRFDRGQAMVPFTFVLPAVPTQMVGDALR